LTSTQSRNFFGEIGESNVLLLLTIFGLVLLVLEILLFDQSFLAAGAELTDNHNYYSFYSQHTSIAFAAGISYAKTYALRHPASRRRWLVYTAAVAGGSAVTSMHVLAGRHFPTDVMTGTDAGTGMGLLIPWLHHKGAAQAGRLPVPSGDAVSLRVPFGN